MCLLKRLTLLYIIELNYSVFVSYHIWTSAAVLQSPDRFLLIYLLTFQESGVRSLIYYGVHFVFMFYSEDKTLIFGVKLYFVFPAQNVNYL